MSAPVFLLPLKWQGGVKMPTLKIQNPTVSGGQKLNFSFSGFPANTPIQVYASLAMPNTPVNITSDSTGSGSGSITISLGAVDINLAAGNWVLYAVDVSNTSIWASAPFTIVTTTAPLPPVINLLPATVKLGDVFDVYLYYFTANSTVTVKVGTTAAGYQKFFTVNIDANGQGAVAVLTTKVVAEAGTYNLIATDTQGKIAQTTLTVLGLAPSTTPVLTIQNPSIQSNGTMVFNFSGFAPNSTIKFTSTGIVGGSDSRTVGADGTGSSALVVIGMTGNYTLKATDSAGHTASAIFTIVGGGPTIAVTISGTTLKYTASNFPVNDTLTITVGINGQASAYTGTVTTNASGTATGTIGIGDFAAGEYLVAADDNTEHSAVTNFAIAIGGGEATAGGTPSTGLFTFKDVTYSPAAPAKKQAFNVKGEIKLFGMPYAGAFWVIAKVTYPKVWSDLIGPPADYEAAVAWFGKFSIDFPKGFSRSGEYTLDILGYLGPEKVSSVNILTNIATTFPPFPEMATWKGIKFSI